MAYFYDIKKIKEITRNDFINMINNFLETIQTKFNMKFKDEARLKCLARNLVKYDKCTYDIGTLAPCIVKCKIVLYDNELYYMNLKRKELYRYEYE